MGNIKDNNSYYVVNEDGTILRNRKCPKCGGELFSEGDYCEHCGASLSGSKNRNAKWIMLVSVFVLCIIVIGSIAIHQHSLYVSALERVYATQCDTSVVSGELATDPVNNGQNCENDVAEIIQQRDDLLLEVQELQEKTRKLQNKVNELDEENGYLTTDVRLATEALKECMGK